MDNNNANFDALQNLSKQITALIERSIEAEKRFFEIMERLAELDDNLNDQFQIVDSTFKDVSTGNMYFDVHQVKYKLEIDEEDLFMLVMSGRLRFITYEGKSYFRKSDVEALFTFDRSKIKNVPF